MKAKELFTKISLEDFKKLNLIGFKEFKHYKDDKGNTVSEKDTGEWLIDSRGGKHYVSFSGYCHFLDWEKVNLNDVIGNEKSTVVILHTEPDEDEVAMILDEPHNKAASIEDAYKQLLFNYSFGDYFSFPKTYQIIAGVKQVRKRYGSIFIETEDGVYEFSKKEIKCIFWIKED